MKGFMRLLWWFGHNTRLENSRIAKWSYRKCIENSPVARPQNKRWNDLVNDFESLGCEQERRKVFDRNE